MDEIKVRYGESLTLPVDADDITAVSATLYVGLPGEIPVLIVPTTLTDGVGTFELSPTDTELPLGSYKYQITVVDEAGNIAKYPDPDDCSDCDSTEGSFPDFKVYEALDSNEVS